MTRRVVNISSLSIHNEKMDCMCKKRFHKDNTIYVKQIFKWLCTMHSRCRYARLRLHIHMKLLALSVLAAAAIAWSRVLCSVLFEGCAWPSIVRRKHKIQMRSKQVFAMNRIWKQRAAHQTKIECMEAHGKLSHRKNVNAKSSKKINLFCSSFGCLIHCRHDNKNEVQSIKKPRFRHVHYHRI